MKEGISGNYENIDDPVSFFRDLGNIHDAKIESIVIDLARRRIFIHVDDLYRNFVGLSDYKGAKPCDILLNNVREFRIFPIDLESIKRIIDFETTSSHRGISIEIKLSPAGSLFIECESISVSQ